MKQRSARPADASSCRPALGGLPPRSTATRVSIREVNYALGRRRRTARRRGARMIPGARPLIRQRAYGAMWSQPDADHNCASAEASRRLVGERARMNSSIYRRASERDKRTGRSLARWLFIDTTPRRPRLARSCSAVSSFLSSPSPARFILPSPTSLSWCRPTPVACLTERYCPQTL